jgi:hypothetical protein
MIETTLGRFLKNKRQEHSFWRNKAAMIRRAARTMTVSLRPRTTRLAQFKLLKGGDAMILSYY